MVLINVNPKAIRKTTVKVIGGITGLAGEANQHLIPLLKILWRSKLVIISAINAVISILLVVIWVYKLISLLKSSNYWWSVGEQSGVRSANSGAYYLSLAENNIVILFLVLAGLIMLACQTIRLFNRIRTERWDKRGRKGRIRLIGLLVYLIVIVTTLVLLMR